MSATVIIPITGNPVCRNAIESALNQTYPTTVYVVVDGQEFKGPSSAIVSDYLGSKNLKVCYLPINVGANGFYGHRAYAAFTHLINTDYVLYLDQDVSFKPNHVQSCVELIEKKKLDWCHSLREIYDHEGNYVCRDDCESLGKYVNWQNNHHVDTNTYCLTIKTAIRLASTWHGGWGQDRIFYATAAHHYPNFDCTGDYTVKYKLAGNEGSVTKDFFAAGNKVTENYFKGNYPWRKKI
jgi:glycosyltransferase involved in cell wall biosynthesis